MSASAQLASAFRSSSPIADRTSATTEAAKTELIQGLSGLSGNTVKASAAVEGAGAVVLGTASSEPIKSLPLAARLTALGPEGYLVETAEVQGQTVIAVAGNTEIGVLYGSFALLRHLASHGSLAKLSLSGSPRIRRLASGGPSPGSRGSLVTAGDTTLAAPGRAASSRNPCAPRAVGR